MHVANRNRVWHMLGTCGCTIRRVLHRAVPCLCLPSAMAVIGDAASVWCSRRTLPVVEKTCSLPLTSPTKKCRGSPPAGLSWGRCTVLAGLGICTAVMKSARVCQLGSLRARTCRSGSSGSELRSAPMRAVRTLALRCCRCKPTETSTCSC